MKYFKRIALLIVAATLAVCVGIFAAACEGDNTKDEFTVTVYYSDGVTTVDGTGENYQIQICSDHESFSSCLDAKYNAKVDKNGKASFDIATVNAVVDSIVKENGDDPIPDNERAYTLHVVKEGTELEHAEARVTMQNKDVKIILTNVTAP